MSRLSRAVACYSCKGFVPCLGACVVTSELAVAEACGCVSITKCRMYGSSTFLFWLRRDHWCLGLTRVWLHKVGKTLRSLHLRVRTSSWTGCGQGAWLSIKEEMRTLGQGRLLFLAQPVSCRVLFIRHVFSLVALQATCASAFGLA